MSEDTTNPPPPAEAEQRRAPSEEITGERLQEDEAILDKQNTDLNPEIP